jgi:isopentenyldiphosphate isomerase
VPKDEFGELFDVVDARGRPLGVKPRGLVHREGDWHRTIHIWVVLVGDPPLVVLQRRSLTKDSHPGMVDVSVAGHLHAGETTEDGLREADEEIGLLVTPKDVVRLGVRRNVDVRGGCVDREIQEVFLVAIDRTLASLSPDPDEVLSLLTVALPDAFRLATGEAQEVFARELTRGSEPRDGILRGTELLPSQDGYFGVALRAIAARLTHPTGPHDVTFDLPRG